MRLLLLLFLLCTAFTPVQEQGCTGSLELNHHNYTYKLAERDVLVMFENDEHTEYHQNKKYVVKSAIEWISPCEYYLTVQSTTLPDFPFEMGSKLHVKITRVKGNNVYFKTTFKERSWEGKMERKTQ